MLSQRQRQVIASAESVLRDYHENIPAEAGYMDGWRAGKMEQACDDGASMLHRVLHYDQMARDREERATTAA